MDILEYFDEEYASMRFSIDTVTSVVSQCSNNIIQLLEIQKRIQRLYTNKNLNIEQLKITLDSLSIIAKLISELLDFIQDLKSDTLFKPERS